MGLFLFPTLLLERNLSVVDQFLKGETMTVQEAKSGASSETSTCSRSSGNMSSVRSGYSADWEAGV